MSSPHASEKRDARLVQMARSLAPEKYIVTDTDEGRLRQTGYKSELERNFSVTALGALCLTLMATWEALSTVVAAALINGGAPCLFYNYVVSFLCTIAVALSLGEIASMYPTAGGQYYWVAALSPPSYRHAFSYFTGWISVGAQIVFSASAAFAAGLQTQSLIIMNSEEYSPTRWQGMLFYWAAILYSALMNILGHRMLPHVNYVSGIIHITAFAAIIIVLGVMSDKNLSSFVFIEVTNSSGWSNDGVSWLIGLLSTIYPFLGYDAASHLSEEIPHASRNVPIAMVGSVVVNGIIGLIYCIVLLFSIGSLESLLETSTGFPFMQIYLDVTRSVAGATIMSILITIIAYAANVACITSASRTLWAYARDRAVPFDRQLSKVSHQHQVPVSAILVVTVLQMLLGFLYLGNTTAFNAVLATAVVMMYSSYLAPIACMLFYGRSHTAPGYWGVWRLPKPAGITLNIISILWMLLCIVFSFFPTAMPVTAQNMNYSVVVVSGWSLIGALYYVVWGQHKYDIPYSALVITSHSVLSREHVPIDIC